MMTKKHFNKLAEILKNAETKKEIINQIAFFCYEQNPNFNGYRFKKACGLNDNEI
jgi:hypothetical protein